MPSGFSKFVRFVNDRKKFLDLVITFFPCSLVFSFALVLCTSISLPVIKFHHHSFFLALVLSESHEDVRMIYFLVLRTMVFLLQKEVDYPA